MGILYTQPIILFMGKKLVRIFTANCYLFPDLTLQILFRIVFIFHRKIKPQIGGYFYSKYREKKSVT